MVALRSSLRLSNMENITLRRVWNLYASRSWKRLGIFYQIKQVDRVITTYHIETLPDLRPFAQDLRAFGDHRIDFREVLDVYVGLGEETHCPRLSGAGAAVPVLALLHNVHGIADIQCQAEPDIAVPVVDGCWRRNGKMCKWNWEQEKLQSKKRLDYNQLRYHFSAMTLPQDGRRGN